MMIDRFGVSMWTKHLCNSTPALGAPLWQSQDSRGASRLGTKASRYVTRLSVLLDSVALHVASLLPDSVASTACGSPPLQARVGRSPHRPLLPRLSPIAPHRSLP